MAEVVIMPKQGQSVESCILTQLMKKKGDKVAVGDVLFACLISDPDARMTRQVCRNTKIANRRRK